MQTFLEETLLAVQKENADLSSLIFILPSKRAGGFLKNLIRETTSETMFTPKIISIEEFIEELSDLKIIDPAELLFKSYEAYLKTESNQEKDDFETYTSWASTLLADFNEIDRYLVDPKSFFSYLNSIQDINHWYVSKEKTPLIENYLKFWNSLYDFYQNLGAELLSKNLGYQGMVYKKAAEDIEFYCRHNGNRKHIFIGFNALNNAEQHIIQELLETQKTTIYWDADAHFYHDPDHGASHFIRNYIRDWKYFQTNSPKFIGEHFKKEKRIQFIEVQKNVAQAKYVGELLKSYTQDELNKTAIVLSDEKLLLPILHSLPSNVDSVNITMGISLKNFPTTSFFDSVLSLHMHPRSTFYYKDVLAILNHPVATYVIPTASDIVSQINSLNLSHLSIETLINLNDGSNTSMLALLFGEWKNASTIAIDNCLQLLLQLKSSIPEKDIERVVIHQLHSVFSKVQTLNHSFPFLKSVKTVHSLFSEFISTSTLDFQGDAYSGLQIMGVLETRVLDFENVIITSVNEGILPAGKSNASFITSDLKQQFGLPRFTEKDAIYTYHFYHLLHRSKNISILYNNHSDGINAGEKSRFLLQLEIEQHPNHILEKLVLAPSVHPKQKALVSVSKTTAVLSRLQEIASKGFSPSALTTYVRNPMDFYIQKILKINEYEEVEETIAANTLGTIVHDTLEIFYKPYKGMFLTEKILLEMKNKIDEEVRKQFLRTFKGGTFDKGKNLIIFEVAQRYLSNFIDFEIAELKAGNKIKIIQIEASLDVPVSMPELHFPVLLGGKVDRVDEYNGQLRIIDYKTGKVEQRDLEIINWEEITSDYKYSKAIQVLAYALMINHTTPLSEAQAGIISFKNLNSGFLKFATKPAARSTNKNFQIGQDTLASFLVELKKLILEICDPEIPFIEKEI